MCVICIHQCVGAPLCVSLKGQKRVWQEQQISRRQKVAHAACLRPSPWTIRRTLPAVHRLTVIIRQTQTLASDKRIDSLHGHFSAWLSKTQTYSSNSFFHLLLKINCSLKRSSCQDLSVKWNITITRLPVLNSGSIKVLNVNYIRKCQRKRNRVFWITDIFYLNKCKSLTMNTDACKYKCTYQ